MKPWIIAVMLAFALTVVSVNAESLCTDSDGGENYDVKGTLTIQDYEGFLTDLCQIKTGDWSYSSTFECSGDTCYLEEAYCEAPSKSSRLFPATYFPCPNGCKDGACIGIDPSPSTSVSLLDYPDLFRSNPPVIVVGHTAPAGDVITAVDTMNGLKAAGIDVGPTRLDTEIDDLAAQTAQNLISIGNACDNKITAELLGNPEPCFEAIPIQYGLIKLKTVKDKTAIVVAARDAQGTRRTARVLANWKNLPPNSVEWKDQTEVLVPLSQAILPPPQPTPITAPVPPEHPWFKPGDLCTIDLSMCKDVPEPANIGKSPLWMYNSLLDGTIELASEGYVDKQYLVCRVVTIKDGIEGLQDWFVDRTEAPNPDERWCGEVVKSDRQVAVPPTPTQPVPPQTTPPAACNGCETQQGCLPFGIGLVLGETPSYCDIDKTIKARKATGDSCQNNFECQSNSCPNLICNTVDERLVGCCIITVW